MQPVLTRRPRAPLTAALLAGLLALGPVLPAQAADQTDQMSFDLVLKGLTAGRLTIDGKTEGSGYAAVGTLQSTGILAWIKKIRYDASVSGRVSGSGNVARYTPVSYSEKADTGKRQSESVMAYKGGVPQVKVYNPPRAAQTGDVDPAKQGGTVDPLSALFITLRDVPAAQACNRTLTLFDGKRRSQVVLGAPVAAGDGLACAGEYRRLEGFSADEMAEKSRFPFQLALKPAENGMMRVDEVSMDTLYGKGALKRR
jgi:hypothetical protein